MNTNDNDGNDNSNVQGEEEYLGEERGEDVYGDERNYGGVEEHFNDDDREYTDNDDDGDERNEDGNRIYGEEEEQGNQRDEDEEVGEEEIGERDRFDDDDDENRFRPRRNDGGPPDGDDDPDDEGNGGGDQPDDFEDDDAQNNDYEAYDPDEDDEIPEYANEANKKLNEDIKLQRRNIKQLQSQYEEVKERLGVMKDHQKFIMIELKNTQAKIEVKNEETSSEKHMLQLAERQIGKVTAELRKYDQKAVELQDRLNDIQQQIFKGNDNLEKLKLEMNWNKEEKKQWMIAVQQKEEDNVVLAKYKRSDDKKIKELSLQLEKLTMKKNEKEDLLEKEITATKAFQIEIDKTAEEFKKQHAERHKIYARWDEAIQNIAYRHESTLKITTDNVTIQMQMKSNQEILQEKKKQLDREKDNIREGQDKNHMKEREISDLKAKFETLKKEEIDQNAEVKINQNTLSADSSRLAERKNMMEMLERELQNRKRRLTNADKKYKAQKEILKSEETIEKLAMGK